jgi:hypothetical protein
MRITRRDLMRATAATALAGFVGDAAAAESAGAVRVALLTVHEAWYEVFCADLRSSWQIHL